PISVSESRLVSFPCEARFAAFSIWPPACNLSSRQGPVLPRFLPMVVTMEWKDHLSYVILSEAADKTRPLESEAWAHVLNCDHCMLRLANIAQVRADLDELHQKYPAA